MIVSDEKFLDLINIEHGVITTIITIVLTAAILLGGFLSNKRSQSHHKNVEQYNA
jgi:hypothetical protein